MGVENNEDLQQEVVEGQEQEPQEQQGSPAAKEPEYSDNEKKAMAQGWVPEDQYEGTGKWRSAEEFLDRGELFSKIDEQNRKLRATEATLDALKKHHKRTAEIEYKRALTALKAEKKEALDVGDTERVVDIDEQIAETKAEAAKAIAQMDHAPAQAEPNPQFMVWVNKNPWYQNDRAMKIYADTVGDELAAKGMRDPTEILLEVERRTKKEFAHKFNNPNRGKPGAVEGGGRKGSQKQDTFQLTPEETQVMNKFVRHGVMTREEYIAEAKAQRGEG
jgi:hypothetical protein